MLATDNKPIIQTYLKDIACITLFLAVLYGIFLGWYALFTPDEGRYSEVAREMVLTGDYISPHLNGVIFLDKPILYYWLQASAIRLFGLHEWSLRFWPACIGILGAIMTYLSGSLLFNRRTGQLAAIILATCIMYFGGSHYANLDLEVAVFISSALLSFLIALQTHSKKTRLGFLLGAYLFTSLAVMTKGLIGIVFPAVIVGLWIIVLNRWKLIPKMHLLLGLMIFLSITAPWFILVQKANPQFLHYFFIEQQFSRFMAKGHFNNLSAPWFYIPIIIGGLVPWSVFLIQSLYHHVKLIWNDYRNHASEIFLLLWAIIIFTFFSIPKSKTLGYILPVFPALALLIAHYLNHYWHEYRTGIVYGVIAFIALCELTVMSILCLLFIHAIQLDPGFSLYLAILGSILSLGGMITAYLFAKKSLPKIFICMTAIASGILLTILASADVINHKSIKPLAMQIKPILKPTDDVVTYYRYFQDLPIYLERRITIVARWHANDIPQFDNWLRELWLGMPYQDTHTWLIEEPEFWERWHSQKRLFVLMNSIYYREFKEKAKTEIYRIGNYGDVYLISNSQAPTEPITDRSHIRPHPNH